MKFLTLLLSKKMTQVDYKFHLHEHIMSTKKKKTLFLYAIGIVLKNRWKITLKQVVCVYICYVKRGKSFGLMRKSSSVKSVGGHFSTETKA